MADLIADLKALRLYGMAACYAECIEQGSTGGLTTYESLLSHLVQAETTDRALRSIRYRCMSPAFRFIGTSLASISSTRKWIAGRS